MESKNSNNPLSTNLQQYFANDPPSFFDNVASSNRTTTEQIASGVMGGTKAPATTTNTTDAKSAQQITSLLTNSTFSGGFKPPEYVENASEMEEDQKYPDVIRNCWPPPPLQTGIPPLLTTPGILTQTELPDLIGEVVAKHLGDEELDQRKILTPDCVTQDERGIRTLIAAGCYRAAINLTGRLLTVYGQGYGRTGQPTKHSPFSLQLWFTRLALLTKVGEYELLRKEGEPFEELNRPDIFYEFYPDMHSDKVGSMACFSFRLLLAELPLYTGNSTEALDRLSHLYVICHFIKEQYIKKGCTEGVTYWNRRETRVLHAMINCALTMKKFSLIDEIIRDMLFVKDISKEEKRSLFSAWGRIYLQIGDIFGAEQKFAEARRLREINSQTDLRDLVDKGLITVAKNDFPEAYTIFQKALHLESGNTMILNNMGVCLLYAGKLKDAINLFERAINLNPQKSLNESLLINLSTLYELESNNSKTKKLNLLRLINKYKPDLSINLEICLKLQSAN